MPRLRHDDEIEDPAVWQLVKHRAKGWALSIALFFGGSLCTVVGIRTIPGGVVVGSTHDLAMLQLRVDTLSDHSHHTELLVDERIRLDEVAIERLEGFADAVTREKCSTAGAARAKAWGYDCDGAVAPLPSRR